MVRQLIQYVRKKSYNVWERPSDGKGQRNGRLVASSTTKTRPCHKSPSTCQVLMGTNMSQLPSYPAHSPDLSPCNSWLLPKFKGTMKMNQFAELKTSFLIQYTVCERFQNKLPGKFPTVAEALEQVCVCVRAHTRTHDKTGIYLAPMHTTPWRYMRMRKKLHTLLMEMSGQFHAFTDFNPTERINKILSLWFPRVILYVVIQGKILHTRKWM